MGFEWEGVQMGNIWLKFEGIEDGYIDRGRRRFENLMLLRL